jgi:hypothetical protein
VYGSIWVSFFLERVPHFQLHEEWRIPAPRDPIMKRWCDLMARHVAGPIIKYNDAFFNWLRPQILMIDDYVYVVLEFWGDPDLGLLERYQWGDLGKKDILFFIVFCVFLGY